MTAYAIDRGPAALPTSTRAIVQRHSENIQRFTYDGPGSGTVDPTLPEVSNVDPAEGVQRDRATGVVGFDLTDSGGNLTLARVQLLAFYPALRTFEVVYCGFAVDDWPAGFGPQYRGSIATITNGFRFSGVIRQGGWPAAPTLVPLGIDAAGNINA